MTASLFNVLTRAELNGVVYRPAGGVFAVEGTVYPGAPEPPSFIAGDNGGYWCGFASGVVGGLCDTQDGLWVSPGTGYPAKTTPMWPSVQVGRANLNIQLGAYATAYYKQHGTYDGMVIIGSAWSQGAMVWCQTFFLDILPSTGTLHYLLPYVYRLYLFGDIFRCFPPGTLVRMADGTERPIEDVHLGDQVVTAEGNLGSVTGTAVREESNQIAVLDIIGHKHLRCTVDHPILTDRGYVKAEDLTEGDWIALPKHMPESTNGIDTHAHVYGSASKQLREQLCIEMPEKIELDADFGRLIGLYLAEGSCDRHTVKFDFHANETNTLAADVVRIAAKYGIDGRVYSYESTPNSVRVALCATKWSRLLKSLCGSGAGKKTLHGDLSSGPKAFLEAVLQGWLDGDGHFRRDHWSGTTVSHKLAMNMYDIAQALDLKPTISTRQRVCPGKKTQRVWELELASDATSKSLDEFESQWTTSRSQSGVPGVSFHQSYKGAKKWRASIQAGGRQVELGHYLTSQEAAAVVREHRINSGSPDNRGRTQVRLDDTHAWRRVKSVKVEPYYGPVHDITVAGDHSFVAEGIGVHNCPGIAHGNDIAGIAMPPKLDGVTTGGIGGPLDYTVEQANMLAPDGKWLIYSFVNPNDLYADSPCGDTPWTSLPSAGSVEYLFFQLIMQPSFGLFLKLATLLDKPIGDVEALLNTGEFFGAGNNAGHFQYGPGMLAAINDALVLGNSLPNSGC